VGVSIVSGGPDKIEAGDILFAYGSVWKIVWDGWEGTLVLRPEPWRSHLEKGGKKYSVRYQILANPQDIIGGMQGPGYIGKSSTIKHRIVFWVDFNNTPTPEDDQRFDGYVFTQTIKKYGKQAMAGITWWNRIPFGFYATFRYDVPG
jgi:hypothetical protein